MSNYPPGVSGNEPQITGEWPCSNCGAILPETPSCPECTRGEMQYVSETGADGGPPGEGFTCECGHSLPADFDTCPGGCAEPDYDAEAERQAEAREERYGY